MEEGWLRVTAEEVNIRSRPDTNSLPVARVPRGTLLRALGRGAYGWYRVVPPEGVFSFVASEYIDRVSSTEGVVNVRSGALRVRVGSLVQDVDPQQCEVQVTLARGTRVQIVGEHGSWLKIVPPEGVQVYVAGQHVERVSAETAAEIQPATRPARAPGGERTARAAGPATRPASGPDLSGTWGQRLTLVEAAIAAEGGKPAAEQSWSEALTRLKPIAAQRDEPMVAALAQAWITRLEERVADAAALRDAEEVIRRAARDRSLHERELERIERARQATTRPTLEIRGEVVRSLPLIERPGRRWYKIQDPGTKRIEAYIEVDETTSADPEKFLGQVVVVRGTRRIVPGIGAGVWQVEEIVPLEQGEAATRPARGGP